MTGWSSVTFMALLLPQVQAASLVAISGDPNNNFVPDQFSSLTDSPGSLTTIATLGDGSLGFNGGLTVGAGGTLYAIANDSLGNSSLYTVQPNGSTALVGSAGGLGAGFLGGLAWDSVNSTLYAAVLDTLGNTSLYSITAGGVASSTGLVLGTSYVGLTFDSANGLFYGISLDSSADATLFSFALGGPVNSVGALGPDFGALSYDAAGNVLWAISPLNNVGSQLFQITSGGAVSSPFYTLGDGFVELAVIQAQGAGVPEPAQAVTVGAGLVLIAFFRRRL